MTMILAIVSRCDHLGHLLADEVLAQNHSGPEQDHHAGRIAYGLDEDLRHLRKRE